MDGAPGGFRNGRRQKKGFGEDLGSAITAEIETLIGPGAVNGLDFEAVETASRRLAFHLTARAVEARLNADTSDHTGPFLPCDCGGEARYAGRRAKRWTTVLGAMTLERAYYHCPTCGSGFCPRDRALGLEDASLSPALTRLVGLTAARVSFGESSALLDQLAGVPVEAKQVERVAEALGRDIARDERADRESTPPSAPTLYLGMDDTGVPMRPSELVHRAGKQPDGSAKTREVKLVTVWSAEGRDEEGVPVRDPGSVTYSAALESAARKDTESAPTAFAQRVEREAQRRGFDQAARQAILGDGAPWIWNLASEQFPNAIQIVDRYHAKEKLHTIAKDIYGAGSDLALPWARQRCAELDAGDIETILQSLAPHAESSEEARKGVGYFTANRHRMRYAEFRAQGFCTSTGVVEAGCKRAVGDRLKRAGMHWTVNGADAIIALRCCLLSGRFEDYWERRSRAKAAGDTAD